MSEDMPDVARALAMQGGICRNMGSPLNGDLLDRAAADWMAGGPVRGRRDPGAGAPLGGRSGAGFPLRLIASWHGLALPGDDPAVAGAYGVLDPAPMWAAARPAMTSWRDRLMAFMTHEP